MGTLVSKEGKYNGNFFQDRFNGHGIFVDQSGNIYEGDWVLGLR